MTRSTPPATVLLLPGIFDSGPGHWQTLWESRPGVRRVRQADWDQPRLADWLAELERAVAAETTTQARPVLLAAHSLGCLLTAHWAARSRLSAAVAGALLVAPPDPEGPVFPPQAASFRAPPLQPLPFPSVMVASSDDAYGSLEFARSHAAAWGSELQEAGPRGHLNAESDLGDWPEAWQRLQALVKAD